MSEPLDPEEQWEQQRRAWLNQQFFPRVTAVRRRCNKCSKFVSTNRLSYCTTCKGEICEDCDCGHNTWGA